MEEEWKNKKDPVSDFMKEFLNSMSSAFEVRTDSQGKQLARDNEYYLDGEIAIKATYESQIDWNISSRRVAVKDYNEGTFISTVFLVIDHNHGDSKTPILFETMAWYNNNEFMQNRYSTYEAALTGHNEIQEQLDIAVANNL